MQSMSTPATPPLSLYVHIPWCVRKCPYCDFNSHAQDGPLPEPAYVAALLTDLEREATQRAAQPPLQTIFIGGGTPSLLSPAAVQTLLDGVQTRWPCATDLEVTLEANPGTAEGERFAGYAAAGVTRLSIGVQSFDDAALQRLGRIHDGAEARRAIELAQTAGFRSINLDLMFGLPHQNADQARRDLEAALAFAPHHLSWYQLTLEPNTWFHHAPPPLPDDDVCWAMQEAGQAHLAAAGYDHYEISAFCRPGHACRHNLNYWRFGDYLGIGAGAHGKHTQTNGRVLRTRKPRNPQAYLRAMTHAEPPTEQEVPRAELGLEFMMNALRLRDGCTPDLFEARTGLARGHVAAAIEQAQQRGLLERSKTRWTPTPHGRRFLNDLVALFLPAPSGEPL